MSKFSIEYLTDFSHTTLYFHGYAILPYNAASPEAVRNFIRVQLHDAVDKAVDELEIREEHIEV